MHDERRKPGAETDAAGPSGFAEMRERAERAGFSREEAELLARASPAAWRAAQTATVPLGELGAELARRGYCPSSGPPRTEAPFPPRPNFLPSPPTPEEVARDVAERLRWLPKRFRELEFGPSLAACVAGESTG